MKARARFIVAVLCFTLVLAAVACPARLAFADQLDEKNQELRDLQKDIEEQKALIVSRQKTESSVLKEIGLLEQQVALAEKEIAYISARMTYLDRDIAENQDAIKELEDKLASQKAAYEARLTSIYKAGNVSYLEVLLESESLSDFFSRIRYLRDIAEQDSILIADRSSGSPDPKAQLRRQARGSRFSR